MSPSPPFSLSPLSSPKKEYDYIICGAGCAGLSLVMHLIASGKFEDKKILVADKDLKNKNDRTWCFWEKEQGIFEPVVYKQWQHLWFYSDTFSKPLTITPYTYKLIRGIDFYDFCFEQINRHPNIEFLQAPVEDVFSSAEETGVIAGGKKYISQYVFNSILLEKPQLKPHEYWMLQHFKGWIIEAEKASFDPAVATLMDFRTDQKKGTTFFYVLPFTDKKALIEYTLFSDKLLDEKEYDKALQQYIEKQLGITTYTVQEKEFGVIPMTNYSFPAVKNNIFYIGTAGGQTKGSSGYTFRFIQKQSAAIVQNLLQEGHPFSKTKPPKRFPFYDSILLHILHYNTLRGTDIFRDLFQKNKTADVLQFLDNETNLKQEIRIISSLPTLPFLKAAIRQIASSLK